MVTSDPLSRRVGGLPLLKEAGLESPLEWGADVVCESPQGKCAASEGRVQGKRIDL